MLIDANSSLSQKNQIKSKWALQYSPSPTSFCRLAEARFGSFRNKGLSICQATVPIWPILLPSPKPGLMCLRFQQRLRPCVSVLKKKSNYFSGWPDDFHIMHRTQATHGVPQQQLRNLELILATLSEKRMWVSLVSELSRIKGHRVRGIRSREDLLGSSSCYWLVVWLVERLVMSPESQFLPKQNVRLGGVPYLPQFYICADLLGRDVSWGKEMRSGSLTLFS